jgi:hypothetical protein
VLATRLPWLNPGYGSDPDSYRVAMAARALARTGAYDVSRLPGYPAYEYLTSLSALAPAWVSNLVTALFSVAAFVLFALLLRELSVRRYLLMAFALALTPVIYLNSCCTMDYIPAVTLQLAATYAVLRQRPLLGGLLLGVAMGFRITAAALALPLCLWMWLLLERRLALRQALVFTVTLLWIGALCYLPVWHLYGWQFFRFYDNDWGPPLKVIAARALPLVWGALGVAALIGLGCALPFYYRFTAHALRHPPTRAAAALAASSVLLYLIAFLRLPDEAGYLVPAVPFVLLAMALLTPAWACGTVAVLLLASPWFGAGSIVEDHLVRESQQRATRSVVDAVAQLPGRAVIVCGWVLPRITLELGAARAGPHQFVYLIESPDDYRHYLAEGRDVYYLPGVDRYESQAHELELSQLGARQLAVAPERQRPASTGE